ncbi:uncharacterized protein BCR38DRAFT_454714 [Pseudomassariella vexata]|uniref:RING-type domain-containing protein n=1 Tax=Pseudomassariella vexata TaxID=1141098 RepID=A0A1Y2EDY3_9PEZI|nr:uncharacterized protein BCR38DRAFT_454714 [Pseudomassariella vexata]ORY69782.1 hypothetical protein BCR38DRAFT_454714 [Pseudomassariella vexata]
MDSPRPGVDLEKELTCSVRLDAPRSIYGASRLPYAQICTELLYQPLTLLDCLHTFCGSCLKHWFSWQAAAALNSPNPPAPGTQIATCPSCRALVRETKHNATVTTLLEMLLSAHPEKARSAAEVKEMEEKYKHGDTVLPPVRTVVRSREEQRWEDTERQMLERAREISLRDNRGDSPGPSHSRQRRDLRLREDRSRSDRDSSRDSRRATGRENPARGARDEGRRRRTDSNARLQPDSSSSDERRHGRSESRQRSRDSSNTRSRAIEHQASIRSLISSSDVDSLDFEREIEDFARQITQEGLLDGLDLDNIDLTQNDELSRKITEAYRRRQAQRQRHETSGRSGTSHQSHRSDVVTDTARSASRQRARSAHTRSSISTNQLDDRSRPPITSTHLQVRAGPERRRRRTSSCGRSATEPLRPSPAEARPAARSQTDLTLRSHTSSSTTRRASFAESRSSSMPTGTSVGQGHTSTGANFDERSSASQVVQSPRMELAPEVSSKSQTKSRPTSLPVHAGSPMPSLGLPPSPGRQRTTRSQFYPEPSITCRRCDKPHIEYELHYNCSKCIGGEWNICLDCYRTGQGCLHWLGFGYAAFNKWEKLRASGDGNVQAPHMLTSNRYKPPKMTPGGADGRRTMTTDDPMNRLESGMFCSRCFTWANECFWRCDFCNEGDWGFCNKCVNQGRTCTHPLLPLTYVPPHLNTQTPPASPRSLKLPTSASLYSGPNAIKIGNFRPLTFTTICGVCQIAIPPTQNRCHCYSCTGTVGLEPQPGHYEVCLDCYTNLVSDGRISAENGPDGWRRCLDGHRMVIINYQDGKGGQTRHIERDLVGGWDLHAEPYGSPDASAPLRKLWWYTTDQSRLERLVTCNVAATSPSGPSWTDAFPADGGVAVRGRAKWSWYPKEGSDDELLFPKGAEIREIEDVNGGWFFGSYMGAKGLFPAPYVGLLEA